MVPPGTDPITLVDMRLDELGPHWIDIRSENGSIVGEANPILVVDDPAHRLY